MPAGPPLMLSAWEGEVCLGILRLLQQWFLNFFVELQYACICNAVVHPRPPKTNHFQLSV